LTSAEEQAARQVAVGERPVDVLVMEAVSMGEEEEVVEDWAETERMARGRRRNVECILIGDWIG